MQRSPLDAERRVTAWVMASLLIERLAALLLLPPFVFNDSPSYSIPARFFTQHWTFVNMAQRLPAYPLLLSFFYSLSLGDVAIVAFQHTLGLFAIYLVLRMISGAVPKLIAGLFFMLDMNLLLHEHAILPDLLLTLEITAIVYSMKRYFITGGIWVLGCAGAVIAAAVLTKPVFQLYPWFAAAGLLVVWAVQRAGRKEIGPRLAVFLLPAVACVGLWSFRNYEKFHFFGMTPYSGFQKAACVEDFIDFSSPSYPELKAVFKRKLEAKKTTGEFAVRGVWQELSSMPGNDEITLNRQLGGLYWEAVRKYPLKYVARAAREEVKLFLSNDSILAYASPRISALSMTEEFRRGNRRDAALKFILNLYLVHWLMVAGFVFSFFSSGRALWGGERVFRLFALLTIFYVTGVTVFADYGLARYRLPVQPLIIMFSASGWARLITDYFVPA